MGKYFDTGLFVMYGAARVISNPKPYYWLIGILVMGTFLSWIIFNFWIALIYFSIDFISSVVLVQRFWLKEVVEMCWIEEKIEKIK